MNADVDRAIRSDCEQLITRFYYCLDEHLDTELAGLFADDGVWVRLGQELVGPERISEALQTRDNWLTAHVLTNLLIVPESQTRARSSQYVTLYRHEEWEASMGPAPVVLPLGILRHRDVLIREDEDAEWKFLRKESRAVMVDRTRVTHYDKR